MNKKQKITLILIITIVAFSLFILAGMAFNNGQEALFYKNQLETLQTSDTTQSNVESTIDESIHHDALTNSPNTSFLEEENSIQEVSTNLLTKMYALDSDDIKEITKEDYQGLITAQGWDNMKEQLMPFQEPNSNTRSVSMLDNSMVYTHLVSEDTANALCVVRINTHVTMPEQEPIQSQDIHMVTLSLKRENNAWLVDNIQSIQTITDSIYDTNALFS